MSNNNTFIQELATFLEKANKETWKKIQNSDSEWLTGVVQKAKNEASRRKNTASQALAIALRHEWDKTHGGDSYWHDYERRKVKNLIRKVPKDRRIAGVIKNATADEAAIQASKRAVKNGNVNAIKQFYRPEFFREIVVNLGNKNVNANVAKAIVPPKTNPETLIHQLLYDHKSPSMIVHIMMIRNVSVEKFINIATSRDHIVYSGYDFKEYALSSIILEVLKLYEKKIKKHVDLRKIPKRKMIQMLESRFEEFSDPRIDSGVKVLDLLEFMIRRGAPHVPVENIIRYAISYLKNKAEAPEWIDQPEFYKLLRLYDREHVNRDVVFKVFFRYADGSTDDVLARLGTFKEILDHIVISPDDGLVFLFAAFSYSEEQPSIPNGLVDYLIARGAKRTPGALAWFEKYARRFVGTPALVADTYKLMLQGLDTNNLRKVRPFNNTFKNIVDHVKTSRRI